MNQIPGDPEQQKNVSIIRNIKKPFWIPVNGGSMRPLLKNGDLVKVNPFINNGNGTLSLGDIVLIARSSDPGLIVHRIVGIGEKWLFEKGDNAYTIWAIRPEDVIGIVTHRRRNGSIRTVSFSLLWSMSSFLVKIGIRR